MIIMDFVLLITTEKKFQAQKVLFFIWIISNHFRQTSLKKFHFTIKLEGSSEALVVQLAIPEVNN